MEIDIYRIISKGCKVLFCRENISGTVKEIARKLIEIQKTIKSLIVLHQQPVNSNVDVVLQNMSGKVDKIPRNFATIGGALKEIIKMLQNQGNNNTDRLDDLNAKMDKVLACLNDLKNSQNSSGDSRLQPNLQSDDNGYNTKAVKF